MKHTKKYLSLLIAALILAIAGCGGTGNSRGKVKVTVWLESDRYDSAIIQSIEKDFNSKNEDFQISIQRQSVGYSRNLSSQLRKKTGTVDVVQIDDRYFKGFVNEGYLTELDTYVERDSVADTDFDVDDMWKSSINRYQYNAETGEGGEGNSLYAIGGHARPTVIYYNATFFKQEKINIISVEESSLDGYNTENQTNYFPRGYYVYNTAPAAGLMADANGKYRIFNNRIGMNWLELVELSKIFTKHSDYNLLSPSEYGFLNEWWFSYGWSIGGDCLEYSEEKEQYVFSLGDTNPNWLITGDSPVTINGNEYNPGDVLSYQDKLFVSKNRNDTDIKELIADEYLYELPSTYEAFSEFNALSQKKGKTVSNATATTSAKTGYGISPSPSTLGNIAKTQYFTSGASAMIVESYDVTPYVYENMKILNLDWDIAVLNQYREYQEDGNLKIVNGTPVVGREAAHSSTAGYAIPANSRYKEYAWEFIKYFSGKDVQKKLAEGGSIIPLQKSTAYSEKYLSEQTNYSPVNKWAASRMTEIGTVGDWSYVEDGEWISGWANILNTDVRNGAMTLNAFFEHSTVKNTDLILKDYKAKKINR